MKRIASCTALSCTLAFATLAFSATPAMADTCSDYVNSWISQMQQLNSGCTAINLGGNTAMGFEVWANGLATNWTAQASYNNLLSQCQHLYGLKSNCVIASSYHSDPGEPYCYVGGAGYEIGDVEGAYVCGHKNITINPK